MDATQIYDPGKTHVWLRTFETAARAYDAAARDIPGAKAKTNVPIAVELLNNSNNFVHINNNTCSPSQSSTLDSSSRLPPLPLQCNDFDSSSVVDYEGMSYKGLLDLDLIIVPAVKNLSLSTLD
ncbi:hypothetical protein HN51_069974 [Arachis hypogaea]